MSKKHLFLSRRGKETHSHGTTREEMRTTLSHLVRMVEQGALSADEIRPHKEALVRELTSLDASPSEPLEEQAFATQAWHKEFADQDQDVPLPSQLIASLKTELAPIFEDQAGLVLPLELAAHTRLLLEPVSPRDTQSRIRFQKTPSATQDIQAGMWLNQRYQLEESLGGGSTGEVFRAFDVQNKVVRAIKVIRPRRAQQPGFLNTLATLQSKLQQLEHRSLVKLFGIERDNDTGQVFQVAEYVEGQSLSVLLQRARERAVSPPLPLETTHVFLRKLLAALEYLHKHNVIHRNLKPSNIMLVPGPRGMQIKLLDVGIPSTLQRSSHPIQHKEEVSKLFYMAPEQLAGQGPYQPSTDLYSVGILLYLMLTGEFPSAFAQRPSELVPSCPSGIDKVLQRAVRIQADNRHQSCADFFGEFSQALALPHTPSQMNLPAILAAAEAPPQPLRDTPSTIPTLKGMTQQLPMGAMPLPVALTPFGDLAFEEPNHHPDITPKAMAILPLRNPEAAAPQVSLSPAGTFLAASANPGGIQLWETGTWRPLYNITCPKPLSTITSLAWSQKDGLVAFASTGGDVWVWNVFNDRCLARLPHSSPVSCLLWLPQNRALCVGCNDGHIHFWSPLQKHSLGYNMSHRHPITDMHCHPDGRCLASTDSGGYSHLIDLQTGQTHLALPPVESSISSLAFFEQNGHMLVGDHDGVIQQWDIEHGSPIHFCIGHRGAINSIAVSQNSAWFASGADDGTIGIWSLKSGQRIATYDAHQQPIQSITTSKDGEWLVSASNDGTIKVWPTQTLNQLV